MTIGKNESPHFIQMEDENNAKALRREMNPTLKIILIHTRSNYQ